MLNATSKSVIRCVNRGFTGFALIAIAATIPMRGQTFANGMKRPAYQGNANGKASAKGSYRIAGVVLNAITGEAIPRATVAVLAIGDSHTFESVSSDSEGHFLLERLPATKFQLTASKRGFRTAFYDEHDEFSTAVVTGPDQDTGHLTFRLTPGANLRGVISTDGGDAVEGAHVMLFERPHQHREGERTAQVDSAMTDDQGTYEFSNLAAGEYLIAVVAEPWYAMHSGGDSQGSRPEGTASMLDVAYPVTYYDSTIDEGAATPIALSAGSREEANISLHAVPALHLTIETPQKQNGSIARAELQKSVFGNLVSAESAGFVDSLRTGKVEMNGVAPGHYQLTEGDPPRVVDMEVSSSEVVDPNAGVPSVSVGGIVRMADGQALPEQMNLTLEAMEGVHGQSQFVAVARKGRFKFEGVTAGLWEVLAEAGGKVLPVIAVGPEGAIQEGNLTGVRESALNLVVSLSRAETRVEGIALKDGKGFAGAMIVLAPKSATSWKALLRRDQSDSDGSFALHDVAPGEYTVIAVEDGWKLDWSRPEAMARYLPKGTSVTVTDKSGALLELSAPVAVEMR